MNFRKYGKVVEEALVKVVQSPRTVMKYVETELLRSYIVGGYTTFPDFYTNARESLTRFEPFGTSQLGAWGLRRGRQYHLDSHAKILIHWPTLIRKASQLWTLHPASALFFYSFIDVVKRHSFAAAELLRRKYSIALFEYVRDQKFTSFDTSPASEQTFSSFDEEILDEMLYEMSREPILIRALRDTCVAIYSVRSPHTERVALARIKELSSPERGVCSIVQPYYAFHHRDAAIIPDTFELSEEHFTNPSFGPPSLKSFLYELLVASDFAKLRNPGNDPQVLKRYPVRVRELGVARVRQPGTGEVVLFINWAKWGKYRNMLWRDSYLALLTSEQRKLGYKQLEVEWPNFLGKKMYKVYPSACLALSECYTGPLPVLWEAVWNTDAVSALSVSKLSALKAFTVQVKSAPAARKRATVRRAPGKPLFHTLDFSTQKDTYSFVGVCYPRKIYLAPPWNVSDPKHFYTTQATRTQQPERRLRDGVVEIPGTNRYYYSLVFLLKHSDYPDDAELIHQLRRFVKMSRGDFRLMKMDATGYSTRRFSAEEDRALIQYYRPKMSVESAAAVQAACPTRSPEALSRRATALRVQLIERGVYNINNLPHGRYNHLIGVAIAKAKASKGVGHG